VVKPLRLLAAGLLLTLALSAPTWAADAKGDWLGSLTVRPGLDLRIAVSAVGEIVGKTATDDLLDSIFSQFCLGK